MTALMHLVNFTPAVRHAGPLSKTMFYALVVLSVVLLYLPANASADSQVCNQHSELCSRAYNDVTFISTHASFALTNATRPSVPGTQYKSITQQLNDGVRGLHLNIVQGTKATDVWLCYPDCNVNNGGTLQDTLSTVKSWMDSNKNDVVTIFLEGNATTASPSAVLSAFTQSGIDKYALTGKPTTWPTLGSMIDDGTTLVVFAESTAIVNANTKGYFIPYGGIVLQLDGPFNYGNEWTCGPWTRSTETILLIPHYIVQTATYGGTTYNNLPYPFNLDTTNGYQYEAHAITCRSGQSIWVNFMKVDFYDQGDVMTPTLKLNSLPYTNDEASNFYPEFFEADSDLPVF